MQKFIGWALAGIFLLGWTQAVWSVENRARAALIRGQVTASDSTTTRNLKRNDLIGVGETIKTGPKGLGQLVFPDRSMLYIKASSELLIEAFHFDAQDPQQDKSVTTIIKGGMRALSGIVGKRNPDNVQYNTRVSTIGIRGTAVDINQGAPECLSNDQLDSCTASGASTDEWAVTFDFGQGWVETEGGRVDVAEGETVRFNRREKPSFARFTRRQGDPAFIARQFAQMEPNKMEAWAKEQAFRLRKEDLFFAIGLFNQSDRFSVDKLQGAIQGFSRAMSREERSEMREFTSRIYPADGPKIMKASTLSKDELSASLESIMRGMDNASQSELEQVYEAAVNMGITLEQAEQVMENLKNDPMQCR